jgi:hypothetical protein
LADILDGATQCQFCAGIHDVVRDLPKWQQPCPRIKKIEFYENGFPSSIEFWRSSMNWEEHIVFPRSLVEDEETEDAAQGS